MMQNSGPTGSLARASSQGAAVFPAPLIHADLAPAAALAAANQQRSAPPLEVALGDGERLLEPQHGAPPDPRSSRAVLWPWRSSPVWRIAATISSTVGGSAG
jgi:hypothetical protein